MLGSKLNSSICLPQTRQNSEANKYGKHKMLFASDKRYLDLTTHKDFF